MYLVMKLMQELETDTHPPITVRINDPKGLCGVVPVFGTKKAAREWYGKDVELRKIEFDIKASE